MEPKHIVHYKRPDGSLRSWRVETLWNAARELETFYMAPRAVLEALKEHEWSTPGHEHGLHAFIKHWEQAEAAKIDFPIILSESGELLDGAHRLAKAVMHNHLRIPCRQFKEEPPSDFGPIAATPDEVYAPTQKPLFYIGEVETYMPRPEKMTARMVKAINRIELADEPCQ